LGGKNCACTAKLLELCDKSEVVNPIGVYWNQIVEGLNEWNKVKVFAESLNFSLIQNFP
jgi:hypothetical protein